MSSPSIVTSHSKFTFRPTVSYLRVLVTNLPTSRLQQSLFPRPAQLQVRHYDHLSARP